ncbi:MAG: hypothetical protein RJB38_2358 [Pseudomonadota bacterium]|jgi:hypothetical protein
MGKPSTTEQKEVQAPKKAPVATVGGCTAKGCRHGDSRFGFCDEHYEQFKFGLIKRTGEQVSDYEKKFEHYEAYQTRRRARKVA